MHSRTNHSPSACASSRRCRPKAGWPVGEDALRYRLGGAGSMRASRVGGTPPTLVTGVLGLRPVAIRTLVLLLALAVPGGAQETWTPTSTPNAPTERSDHTGVWTGSKMIIWGGGVFGSAPVKTGSIYDGVTRTWAATSTTSAPAARRYHTATWTGSKMIVWGGYDGSACMNTGGIYDPATNTWSAMSTTNAPAARYAHTAVWTGSKMIVWGGFDGSRYVSTGGTYDFVTDTWTATSTTNAPMGSYLHTAVWTGSKMIVWGGYGGTGIPVNSGGVYNPVTDTWSPTSPTNAPTARGYHSTVWTGSRMLVWAGWSGTGYTPVNTGGVFDPATNTWTASMSTTNAPSPRGDHRAVWTGSKMIVWGGYDGFSNVNTGGMYDPATDTWTATSTTNAPPGRSSHSAVWTGADMIVWGGTGGYFVSLGDGGIYSNPALLPSLPSSAEFYTVTPCRAVDTRSAPGASGGPALVAGAVRTFPVSGVCGVPSTAIAVSVNLTVTQPAAQGDLTLYPGDAASPPLVSNINFTPGLTLASNAVVLLATNGGTISVQNRSAGAVHFVLDLNGYFE
jgi:N-acetylneuraminic acid mutarotase